MSHMRREVTNRAYSLDKIAKVMWLIDEMNASFRSNWNMVKYLAINEMVVTYKGKFCAIRQFLPNTICKWGGFKVWCVGYSKTKRTPINGGTAFSFHS